MLEAWADWIIGIVSGVLAGTGTALVGIFKWKRKIDERSASNTTRIEALEKKGENDVGEIKDMIGRVENRLTEKLDTAISNGTTEHGKLNADLKETDSKLDTLTGDFREFSGEVREFIRQNDKQSK